MDDRGMTRVETMDELTESSDVASSIVGNSAPHCPLAVLSINVGDSLLARTFAMFSSSFTRASAYSPFTFSLP